MSEEVEDTTAITTSTSADSEKPSLAGGDAKHDRPKSKSGGTGGKGTRKGGREKGSAIEGALSAALLPVPKRVAYPDEDSNQLLLKEKKDKIENLKQQLRQLDENNRQNRDSKDAVHNERGTARKQFNDMMSNVKILNKEREELKNEFESFDEKKKLLITEQDRIRRRLPTVYRDGKDVPIQKVEDVDLRIKELERKIETESLKLPVEKRFLADIQSLKQSKVIIREYQALTAQLEAIKADTKKAFDKYKAKRDEIKNVSELITESKQTLNTFETKIPDKESEQIRNSRKLINGEINTIKTEIDKLWQDYYARIEEAQASEREIRKVSFENSKIKREIEKKLYEEKKKEYEEEMKQYHPYEEELQRCTQLISYLETTLVKHNEHTTKQEAATKESVKVPEDVKLIGKRSKEEEAYFIGGKKSKNSNPATSSAAKQKQPATTETKAPTSTAITHTVNVFTEFQHVGIDPPLSYADIPKTVEELKKKKDYYQTAPPREKPEREEAHSDKPRHDTDKGREANPNSTDDFPIFLKQNGEPVVTAPAVKVEWGAGKYKKPTPIAAPFITSNPTPKESTPNSSSPVATTSASTTSAAASPTSSKRASNSTTSTIASVSTSNPTPITATTTTTTTASSDAATAGSSEKKPREKPERKNKNRDRTNENKGEKQDEK